MSLRDDVPIQDLIYFVYEMNAEGFELAVTATILLRGVRKKRFKRKPTK